MATTLYRIYDPNFPNATRYYGITDSTINLRLYEHTRLARIGTKRMPVLDWIRKLQKENTSPCIETIAVFDTREQARQAEIEHIEMGRKLGYKLLCLWRTYTFLISSFTIRARCSSDHCAYD